MTNSVKPERQHKEAIGYIVKPSTCRPSMIIGHPGNPATHFFQLKTKPLDVPITAKLFPYNDNTYLPAYIKAAKELEKEKVLAITTNCGFTAIFQKELANSVETPVFTSSLLQVPIVHKMLQKKQKVGIVSANSQLLSQKHLNGAGIDHSVPIAISGMEHKQAFQKMVFEPAEFNLDYREVEREVVEVSKRLVSKNPEVGAIVVECTDLSPYTPYIRRATNLPVFDLVTLMNYIFTSSVSREIQTRLEKT